MTKQEAIDILLDVAASESSIKVREAVAIAISSLQISIWNDRKEQQQ